MEWGGAAPLLEPSLPRPFARPRLAEAGLRPPPPPPSRPGPRSRFRCLSRSLPRAACDDRVGAAAEKRRERNNDTR